MRLDEPCPDGTLAVNTGGHYWDDDLRVQRKLQLFERIYIRGLLVAHPRLQLTLIVCLIAAYAHNQNNGKTQAMLHELAAFIREHRALRNDPSLWMDAIQYGYAFNRQFHAFSLSVLPWSIGHMIACQSYAQVTGELVEWRECAKPFSVFKVLLLLQFSGWSSFVFKNILSTLWRMMCPKRPRTHSGSLKTW
jgi:hypothetical protein